MQVTEVMPHTEPDCFLNAAGASIRARARLAQFARGALPLNLAVSSDQAFTASMTCEKAFNESAEDRILNATKVAALH